MPEGEHKTRRGKSGPAISFEKWIAELTADAVVAVSPEGRIVNWNRGAERIFGRPAATILNRRLVCLAAPGREEEWRKITDAAGRGVRIENHEAAGVRKDGQKIEISLSVSPIRSSREALIGAVVVIRDVTEFRRLQWQVNQAVKIDALGQLAGGIAHDFNNVLASMIGYARLAIDRTEEPSEIREELSEILKAGERGRELARQILSFARPASQSVQRSDHDLGQVVRETIKLLRPTIPATVEIVMQIAPDLPPVRIDATQIHQVMMNLCLNASQAMPQGGRLSIWIEPVGLQEEDCRRFPGAEGRRTLQPGTHVVLMVDDTGHGMAPDVLGRMFEPFFTTKKGGSGMGLSVVYGIVRGHGGDIHVYSEPGRGTSFKIYLPASRFAAGAGERKRATSRGRESILVVDDDEALARMIGRTLEKLGYRTSATASSTQALEWVRLEPRRFDLVVTDLTMPGMSGDKLIRQLSRLRPDLAFVICTGFGDAPSRSRLKKIANSRFVQKPFVNQELEKAVRELLDRARGRNS